MVVKAVFLVAHAKSFVPLQTCFFPLAEPFEFFAGTNKKLHLHLFELTHTENKLTCNNLVAESLTYLCDTKRNAHTSGFLHIQEVNKNTLCCFRTQINRHRTVGSTTHFCFKHEVELTNISPVLCSRNWTYDAVIQNNLLQLSQVVGFHCRFIAIVEFVTFCNMLKHARICCAIEVGIERLTKTLCRLSHFLFNFIVEFCNLILNEHIGTIAFLGITIIN